MISPTSNLRRRAFRQLDKVVLNENRRQFNQQDITGETAVVSPIGASGEYGFRTMLVVDLHNQEVRPFRNRIRDREIEGRVGRAFMRTELRPVQIESGRKAAAPKYTNTRVRSRL